MHMSTFPSSCLFIPYNKARAATRPPTIPEPPTEFKEAPLGVADVAAAAAADAREETAPLAAVAAAVAAVDASLKILERVSEDSAVADEIAEETEDETSAASLVAVPVAASQMISDGTVMPAVLQMLPAKMMAAF